MKKIAFLLIAALCSLTASAQSLNDIDFEQLKKLQVAQAAITSLYVDSVDQKKLAEDAIRGMLKELDPHSSYSNPEETKKLNEPLEGSFEGIGVQFNMVEDTLVVIQTISKGPSERAGILAGDRIVFVDKDTIAGVKMDRTDIMKKLRGPKDTKVTLGIVRRSVPEGNTQRHVLRQLNTRQTILRHNRRTAVETQGGIYQLCWRRHFLDSHTCTHIHTSTQVHAHT